MISWAQFLTAGDAIFTAHSLKTGKWYTFRIQQPRGKQGTFYIKYLAGPNNESDYVYMGALDVQHATIKLTKASRVTATSEVYIAANWTIGRLMRGLDTPNCEVAHAGRCGRCGRPLTTPESTELGFGPECASKMGL